MSHVLPRQAVAPGQFLGDGWCATVFLLAVGVAPTTSFR